MEKETMTYELTVTDEYGYNDVIGFDSVYEAEEQLLDSLDRCVGSRSQYEIQALLSAVQDDIREMEEEG